jgi:hypothetical protein
MDKKPFEGSSLGINFIHFKTDTKLRRLLCIRRLLLHMAGIIMPMIVYGQKHNSVLKYPEVTKIHWMLLLLTAPLILASRYYLLYLHLVSY